MSCFCHRREPWGDYIVRARRETGLRFRMADKDEASANERAERYRALAENAAKLASMAQHESIRTAYEILAAQWLRLAELLEAGLTK